MCDSLRYLPECLFYCFVSDTEQVESKVLFFYLASRARYNIFDCEEFAQGVSAWANKVWAPSIKSLKHLNPMAHTVSTARGRFEISSSCHGSMTKLCELWS